MDQANFMRELNRNRNQAQQPLLAGPQGDSNQGFERYARAAKDNPEVCLGSGCCTFCCLAIVIFMSVGSLAPTEYGMMSNRFTKQIYANHIYHGGRYLTGPLNELLVFPATVQNLEFSQFASASAPALSTRTQEGLSLTLHVAFQYHLIPDELGSLYGLTGMAYKDLYLKIARDVLLKSAAQYTAPQYWGMRREIADDMFHELNRAFRTKMANCTGLQLLIVRLPSDYEATIVTTQVMKQTVRENWQVQAATFVRAKIQTMVADYNVNITVTLGSAQANANYMEKAAKAEASFRSINVEAEALEYVKQKLHLDAAGLVNYQRNFAYQQIKNASFMFGIQNAVAVIAASNLGGSAAGAHAQAHAASLASNLMIAPPAA